MYPVSDTPKFTSDDLKRAGEAIADFSHVLIELVARAKAEIDRVAPVWAEQFRRWHEVWKSVPGRLRNVYVESARRGWYLPWDMPLPTLWLLEEGLSSAPPDEFDSVLCTMFEKYPDRVVAEVASRFPSRAPVLSEAMKAHSQGLYSLSTLAFLTQAEGVAIDVGMPDPYDQRVASLLKTMEASADSFDRIMLAPVLDADEIRAPLRSLNKRREIQPDAAPLNRHEIVHGRSCSYGSKTNSLRAALLLHYLFFVGTELEKRKSRPTSTGGAAKAPSVSPGEHDGQPTPNSERA